MNHPVVHSNNQSHVISPSVSCMRRRCLLADAVALNEVVVNRGPSPFLTMLECFVDDNFVTTVQADGVIIATPTGSTAYSMSAGGSIVHPSVPAILLTPICPHSLSFRPLLLPDVARVRFQVPKTSRGDAWVTIDGKSGTKLTRGDGVVIWSSSYPLPQICGNETTESGWFRMLADCLHWNSRSIQKEI